MGEARRKKLQGEKATGDLLAELSAKVDVGRVAITMRKVFESTSASFGRDCYTHAALCQALLESLGVKTRLVIGFAAWRVGEGDGDVVLHAPNGNYIPQPEAAPYHAWLEIGPESSRSRLLLDFTTYSLKAKAAQLDALDGGHTTVDWCPDYLVTPFNTVSPFSAVQQDHAGLYYYEHSARVQEALERTARPLDEDALAMLQLVYRNPDIVVVGPNDVKRSD